MKKISLFLFTMAICLFSACHNGIWDAIDDLDVRVTKLEELCKEMNTNIVSIQTIVNVFQAGDYITSIVEVKKDGQVIGYTITFGKHEPITIYHGQDGQNGADGKDGFTPVIGVAQDTDGVYYWTLNGEWLWDDNGNKLPVSGKDGQNGTNGSNGQDGEDGKDGADGQDGMTPLLKIENGYWYVSYDNGTTWTQLGKATGEDGKDGADGQNGADGKDGQDGDSMFQSVTQDANYVYFTLADGTVIKIAKGSSNDQPNEEFIFTITYDPNGGEGIMEKDTFYYGYANKIQACTFSREEYLFVGWNTNPNGEGALYYPGYELIIEKNIILYAQWEYIGIKTTSGVFSVSSSLEVIFSPGNLQYHPVNNKWRFAESQLDYIGEANINVSSTYDGWLDLFGWSTKTTNFGLSTSTDSNDYSSSLIEWGTNTIGTDAPHTWRTLSKDEWHYVLFDRPNATSRKGIACVNGVNGLVLLPDNWSCPSDITFTSGFHTNDGKEYYSIKQSFTKNQWSKMEASGAIFLPAAGIHDRSYSYVKYVQNSGSYWSTTGGGGFGYYLWFDSTEVDMIFNNLRYFVCSVRLVRNL